MSPGPDWCYSHGRDEPMTPGAPVCGECLHAWSSNDELLHDDNALRSRLGCPLVASVDAVFCCPFCAHDF